MNPDLYLLDTHTLIFWQQKINISAGLINRLDNSLNENNVFISSVSFWEIALLNKKGWIHLGDVKKWMTEILEATGIVLLKPTAEEMVDSAALKDIHNDPFDRLLISQAISNGLVFVTKDKMISKYEVKTLW